MAGPGFGKAVVETKRKIVDCVQEVSLKVIDKTKEAVGALADTIKTMLVSNLL